MSTSSARRGPLWRAEWFAAAQGVAAVPALHLATDAVGTLDRRFCDFTSTSAVRAPSDLVAAIAIDEQSVASSGRRTWPRDVHPPWIETLAAARARTIVDTTFFEPQADRGLAFVRKVKEALAGGGGAVHALIRQAERSLDTDAVLAGGVARAGKVLLPALREPGAASALAPAASSYDAAAQTQVLSRSAGGVPGDARGPDTGAPP